MSNLTRADPGATGLMVSSSEYTGASAVVVSICEQC